MAVLIQFLASAASLGILFMSSPCCRTAPPGEYEVKAAFLYKFAAFVQWPEENAGPSACVGVLGQDPFGAALDQAVKSKITGGKAFLIVRSRKTQDVAGCRIVFISASEKKDLPAILRHISGAVLTVSDIPEFCERGGIIGFEMAEQRVRLRINLDAAARARLQISSKLLTVAKVGGGVPQ